MTASRNRTLNSSLFFILIAISMSNAAFAAPPNVNATIPGGPGTPGASCPQTFYGSDLNNNGRLDEVINSVPATPPGYPLPPQCHEMLRQFGAGRPPEGLRFQRVGQNRSVTLVGYPVPLGGGKAVGRFRDEL